ncbi:hypothetical protein Fot_32195 [Forsythia ovata]|uniref:Uncharacterized protein n=1 Tax=Forsythia ovata TaxID=205694 RepID=A0ABD1T7N3_9LAMI
MAELARFKEQLARSEAPAFKGHDERLLGMESDGLEDDYSLVQTTRIVEPSDESSARLVNAINDWANGRARVTYGVPGSLFHFSRVNVICEFSHSIHMAVTSPSERCKEGSFATCLIGSSIQLKRLIRKGTENQGSED